MKRIPTWKIATGVVILCSMGLVGWLLNGDGATVPSSQSEGPTNSQQSNAPTSSSPPTGAQALGVAGQVTPMETRAEPLPGIKMQVRNLTPPSRPTWEIVRDYLQDPNNPAKAAAALSSLSFCANTSRSAENARQMRSQGLASGPKYLAMQANSEAHSTYCTRLLESEYRLRSDLLDQSAKAGDLDAMEAYHTISPVGEWPTPEQFGDPRVIAWKTSSVEYLQKAAQLGRTDALLLLSNIYSSTPVNSEEAPSVFRSIQDPVKSYAYAHAWAGFAMANEKVREQLQSSGFLQNASKGLNREQVSQAVSMSKQIHLSRKKE